MRKLIVVLIIAFILAGCFIGLNVSKKSETNPKLEKIIEKKKYVLNNRGEEYISFLSDKDYEFKYKKNDESYETLKGNYEIKDNTITLEGSMKGNFKANYITIKDYRDDTFGIKNIYFEANEFKYEDKLIKDAVLNNIKSLKNENKELATVLDVETDIDRCLIYNDSKDDNIICSISYHVYLDGYKKKICNEGDKDKKFFPYIISSGECMENYAENWSFFALKKENNKYEVVGSFTGL